MNEYLIDEQQPSNISTHCRTNCVNGGDIYTYSNTFDQALRHAKRYLVQTTNNITTNDCLHHLNELEHFHQLEVEKAQIPKLIPWTADNKPTVPGEYWVLYGTKRKPVIFWLTMADIKAGAFYSLPYTFWSKIIAPAKP